MRIRAMFLGVTLALAMPVASLAQEQAATARPQGGRYDAEIQQKVQEKLNKDRFKNVKVSVLDQIVELTGTVELMAHKSEADRRARKVERVDGIRNKIQVAGKQVSDTELKEKLSNKLRYDRVGYGNAFNAIEMGVKDGVVTLRGKVRTDMDRSSAIAAVESTPGVKDVDEDIDVLSASMYDDELRIRVAQAVYGYGPLQRYANDPGAPIRIVVDRGRVTLYGMVDSEADKNMAGIQARSVSGAFSVENKLMVAGRESAKK